jgi:hypothetical protein
MVLLPQRVRLRRLSAIRLLAHVVFRQHDDNQCCAERVLGGDDEGEFANCLWDYGKYPDSYDSDELLSRRDAV